jgi:hypothetical protein
LPSLGKGWQYYGPVEKHLRACVARREAGTTTPAPAQTAEKAPVKSNCTDEARVLMLCK